MKKKQTLFSDILGTVTKYFLIFAAIVLVVVLCSSIRIIKTGNTAIVLRFGKVVGDTAEEQVHGPGLLIVMPYFIDEVVTVPSGNVIEQEVKTHYTGEGEISGANGGYVITGDQNIAVVSASVKYVVSDPVTYALNVNGIADIIDCVVSSGMVNESARMAVDSILTDGKDEYAGAILAYAEEKLERLGVGVSITSLELTQVAMPNEVKELYDKVTSASIEAQTIIQTAYQYREMLIPNAQATADSLISEAYSSYAYDVAAATTDVAEFWGCLDEFKTNPELVYARMYSDKVTQMIGRIGRIRVVHNGESKIILTSS